jgi:antitoxin Phd
MVWKLADAKNRLSELMTKVSTEGPQTICRHKETFVVLSESEYRKLKGEKQTFEQFLLKGPKVGGLKPMPRRSRIRDPHL